MSESRHLDRQIQAVQVRLRQLQEQVEVGESQNLLLTEAIAQLSISLEVLQVDTEALHQQNEELQTLLNIASDAIFACDLDHQILYWNQGAEHLYGWTAREAIGQKANVLLHEDATEIAEIMQILLEQGEWRGEIQKVTKAGEIVIVEGRWTLVRDEAGQPKAILKVNTDITAKKSLEAQVYQSQRLESVGTLAGGIAHDLNNVLTPILIMSQLIRSQNTPLEPESQEMLQVIEASAKRGANLVKQILMFTRGTDGQRVPTNLNSLLQEVAQITQQTFPKSIQIREDIPKQTLGQILADPTHLHQVLMNLCVNARDAMPNGGQLTLALEPFYVDELFAKMVLDAQVGHYLLVTVSDTGIGIASKVRDRIFDPFFTTKSQGEGTGLGLSTVLGIVKNYGGFLQVSGKPKKGTQFKVYLPILTETLPDATEQPAELPQGNGELVLIVEDDPAIQRTNQSLLTSYHYRTLVAKDGVEAIALYVKRMTEIKLVLMDVMMPNLDGISTIQALKNINPQVAIIATSGLPVHREAVLAAGARAFLGKPYTVGDLLQALSLIPEKE
jgi:two-component system, cell cycle sensor histidine kinase and response regulator CckA